MPNVFRLHRLVRVLASVPRSKFNLDNWSCGTTACACGWAAVDPVLKKEGLKLRDGSYGRPVKDIKEAEHGEITYRGHVSIKAASVFFGLKFEDAMTLFTSDDYTYGTPKEVIRKIQQYLKKHDLPAAPVIPIEDDSWHEKIGASILQEMIGDHVPLERVKQPEQIVEFVTVEITKAA